MYLNLFFSFAFTYPKDWVVHDEAINERIRERAKEEADHGATPYIPFKTNVTGKSGSELWKKLFHYYSFKREEFLVHYHKRSNVETTFSMIKAKFGERLKSKTETAQINEALCKVLCHNLCVVIQSMYELGIAPEFTSEAA